MAKENKPNHGVISKKEKYDIEIHYSPEAIEKELMRFTVKKGKTFEISLDELIDLAMNNFNKKKVSPMLVKNNVIHMTEVARTMSGLLEKDMKKGEVINIGFKHLIPYEFAVCEEAMRIAKISDNPPKVYELTQEDYQKAQANIDNKVKEFAELQHSQLLDKINAGSKKEIPFPEVN